MTLPLLHLSVIVMSLFSLLVTSLVLGFFCYAFVRKPSRKCLIPFCSGLFLVVVAQSVQFCAVLQEQLNINIDFFSVAALLMVAGIMYLLTIVGGVLYVIGAFLLMKDLVKDAGSP